MKLFLLLLLGVNLAHGNIAEVGVFVPDQSKTLLKSFVKDSQYIVDHVRAEGFELYSSKELISKLEEKGIFSYPLEDLSRGPKAFGYPDPEEIESKLKSLATSYPNIFSLSSIGKSVRGRDLWVMKVSDNVKTDELEPEVKYIANMHGDEIVGRELMVLLLEDMAKRYTKGDPEILELINHTEIFILPSMNPDGAKARRRSNAVYIDLNRDFPDFTTSDNQNNLNSRAPETQAVMKWQAKRQFALSANFHGGAVVANYPWDTSRDQFPLHDLIVKISQEYADQNPEMSASNSFPGGIVNGYDWYEVDGGMQDWSYFWHGDLQVTIELSARKWPSYSSIANYFKDNKSSLYSYLKRVHQGAGIKLSNKSSGNIEVIRLQDGANLGEFPYMNGEFYKVLEEGSYRYNINSRLGKSVQSIDVEVKNEVATLGSYEFVN